MLRFELLLDNIDYDKIFDLYFDKIKAMLGDSEDPAGNLIARMPAPVAKKIWYGLNQSQKEKIASKLIEATIKENEKEIFNRFSESGIDVTVNKISVDQL